MDKVQKYNSFNTNTPSSESYRTVVIKLGLVLQDAKSVKLTFIINCTEICVSYAKKCRNKARKLVIIKEEAIPLGSLQL
jgi:hypothetical protein